MKEALKVQDAAVICPPTPAQYLLEACLQHPDYVLEMSQAVQHRLMRCREALRLTRGIEWREVQGGFFTLAACPRHTSSTASDILLERYGIGTIPGDAFGPCGANHIRISFGCLSDEQLEPALEALASVDLRD